MPGADRGSIQRGMLFPFPLNIVFWFTTHCSA
jgi:hypothetical protein